MSFYTAINQILVEKKNLYVCIHAYVQFVFYLNSFKKHLILENMK